MSNMEVSFKIGNVKPCSINKAYINGRSTLSVDARRFKKRMLLTMASIKGLNNDLKAFSDAFNIKEDFLVVELVFFVPKSVYRTAKGHISRQSGDLDNFLKLTTDILFSPSNMGHTFKGYENIDIRNFNIDDQHISCLTSHKAQSSTEEWAIQVHAKIVKELPPTPPEPDFLASYKE